MYCVDITFVQYKHLTLLMISDRMSRNCGDAVPVPGADAVVGSKAGTLQKAFAARRRLQAPRLLRRLGWQAEPPVVPTPSSWPLVPVAAMLLLLV